jgi:uncharacterized protein (TIGR02246 family)
MRLRPSRSIYVAAATLACAGCSGAKPGAFDAGTESTALLQRDVEWADAATAGKDVEKILSYWTDDAVVMEPGQRPVEGKQAIRAFVTASLKSPGFKIHWVSQKPVLSPDGKMAYMRATEDMTMSGSTGSPMTVHQQGYSIWRKDADGQWRCVVDIANEAPTAKP